MIIVLIIEVFLIIFVRRDKSALFFLYVCDIISEYVLKDELKRKEMKK